MKIEWCCDTMQEEGEADRLHFRRDAEAITLRWDLYDGVVRFCPFCGAQVEISVVGVGSPN